MSYCAVCHREIKVIDAHIVRLKKRKKTNRRYAHNYCNWRLHKFWKYDFGSIITFFIVNFICFVFILLAGTTSGDVILRNAAFIDLAWTFIASIFLFYLNYIRVLKECDGYYRSSKKIKRKRFLSRDEIVTREDITS